MTSRARIWRIGLVIAVLLASGLGLARSARELAIPLGLLVIAAFGLLAELASLRSLTRDSARSIDLDGAQPADGVVDIFPVQGIAGVPCPASPSFRKFVGLEAEGRAESTAKPVLRGDPPLLGRVALISVFVGQDGGSWSDSEIADGFEAIQRAGVWLEQQAIRYGARVNLGLAETYFQWDDPTSEPVEVAFEPEGDDVGPMEAHALTKSVVLATRAASSLGFTDVADWMARINSRVNADGWAWLFHLRQAGRSGAIPGSLCEIPGVGFAICYAREASFPEPLVGKARVDPSTIAHELLHLFGASDKYGIALKKFPNGSVSSKEIMRLNHDSLFRMTIDPLTASEIGWPPRPLPPPPAQKENARRPTSRKVGGRASQD